MNLDMRKSSYASKAHEAASLMLVRIAEEKGDLLRYYNTSGQLTVQAPNRVDGPQTVEFYLENWEVSRVKVTREGGEERNFPPRYLPIPEAVGSPSWTRSVLEKLVATSSTVPPVWEQVNSRRAYRGAERIRDIVNDFDPVTYRLPYEFENRWFRLTYRPGEGITGFYRKSDGRSLLGQGAAPLFTPLYEQTEIRVEYPDPPCRQEQERRLIGRNIRGKHAKLYTGQLEEVICKERGDVFTLLELRYTLPGTIHCSVLLKFFEDQPRVDFRLELGKTLSMDLESVFLPLSLSLDDHQELYLKKGGEAFRPGMDQLPAPAWNTTCRTTAWPSWAKIKAPSSPPGTPLWYTKGKCAAHPILLCNNRPENNSRPIYSWVMNNTWETNFKMDLSGFCEFQYTLWLTGETDPQKAMDELEERSFDPYPMITG